MTTSQNKQSESSLKTIFSNRKFFAIASIYTYFSLVFSSWIIYIPFLAEKLNITEGQIGSSIFFAALGSLIMVPVSNRLTYILGVGRQTFIGFLLYGLSLYGIISATNHIYLSIALFVYGMISSFFVIALNSLIALVEKESGKYIMIGSHGFWSIGGIIGALIGGYIAGKYKMPVVHISILLLLLFSLVFFFRKEYYYIKGEVRTKTGSFKFKSLKPLLAITIIGMIMMISEGAIADWSGLYLQKIVLIKPKYLGLGYAFFSVGMAIGRFSGDKLSHNLGSWKLLSLAFAISLLGFVLVLTKLSFVVFIGFIIIGLGFSVIVPEVYRLASNIEGIRANDGISIIAATSNIGVLIGPALLGFIAEMTSLFYSFVILCVAVLLALTISLIKR